MLTEPIPAPQFKLKDHEGQTHSLSEFEGSWVLLYFYPKDDTPGCTAEACALRDTALEYEEENIIVVGISADDEMSHQKFISKYHLPFLLLSDPEKQVIKMYKAQNETGGTKRISFLINPEGEVEKIYSPVNPETHAEEVLADVRELQ